MSQRIPETKRKPHRKSRKGCRECKERKVKCDECRPTCGNCSVYFKSLDSCHWDSIDSGLEVLVEPSEAAKFHHGSSQEALTQLRLFHHYTTHVAGTMQPDSATWVTEIPSLSLQHSQMLDSLLGLSALHLVHQGDASALPSVYSYLDTALATHRQTVCTLKPEQAATVAISAVLLVRLMRRLNRSGLCLEYDSPSACLRLLRGLRDFARIGLVPHASSDAADAPLGRIFVIEPPVSTGVPTDEGVLHILASYDIGTLLEGLDPLEEAHQVYFTAFESVLDQYNAILGGRSGFAMTYSTSVSLATLPDEFVSLLDRLDPRAICMVAHIYAASSLGETFWWNQGLAYYEVTGMATQVPPEWQWAMQVPLRIVSFYQDSVSE